MDKVFATDDHTAMLEAAGGRAFQFFEGRSRASQFTKSASDVISRQDMQDHTPPDTHFGVHLITMGAEEPFGPNRNGDSSSIAALKKYHGTFEKYGCVFREHKNRDAGKQGVGDVRLARYNDKMHRGELIAWVDKEKALDMYKKASNGDELSWSMSMRLPHDECSICRRKSKRVTDYCPDLRDNMLQYVSGHEKFAYARNEEDVKFFDISEVKRRADRIATYLGYQFAPGDDMSKAASAIDTAIITGAEWAAFQNGPAEIVPFTPWEDITLEKVAAAEEFVRNADDVTLNTLAHMAPQDLSHEQIEVLAAGDFRNVGGELAKKAMIINFRTFASLVTGQSIAELEKNADFCAAEDASLPSLLSDLVGDGGCGCGDDVAESVAPDEVGCSFSSEKDNIDRLMGEVGDELGMHQEGASARGMKVIMMKGASLRKKASAPATIDAFYGGLVNAYGHYLIKAAHQVKDAPGVSETTLYRALAAGLNIQR